MDWRDPDARVIERALADGSRVASLAEWTKALSRGRLRRLVSAAQTAGQP